MSDASYPSTLVFLDTEYTCLDLRLARLWNVGMVVRKPDGTQSTGEVIFDEVDLTYADPMALEKGHFWQRSPAVGGDPGAAEFLSTRDAAQWILERLAPDITDDGKSVPRHIVGCNPIGDVILLRELLQLSGLPWPAHYHVICAEAMAIGALRARGVQVPIGFSSAWLTDQLGVTPTPASDKHTALGDAQWTMRLYDAASRPVSSELSWPASDMLDSAWGIIANVDHGGWDTQRAEWKEAATKWREAYHTMIRDRPAA